jgi:predicted DNA-binding protein with PD1-like motif
MQIIHNEGNYSTFSFKKGEEIMSTLKIHLVEHGIKAAHITGLGAASALEIAYYNIETKEYERHQIQEDVEILSLNGNVGVAKDGTTIIHLHGTFGKQDLSVIGGHIFSMEVSGAGELHMRTFTGKINRAYDEETGLTLMCNVPTNV